jgi:nucleotide-binding universal stress UspA family protein
VVNYVQWRSRDEGQELFRNVLLGIDGSAEATDALSRAIGIARASGGRLGLLSVAATPSAWIALPPFALPVSRAQLAAELEAYAERQLCQAERAVPADVPVTKLMARGSVARALLAQVREGPWDLIVVGHSCCTRRWPLRRAAGARLLRESPVPVLVVRSGEEAELFHAPAAQARPAARSRAPAIGLKAHRGRISRAE